MRTQFSTLVEVIPQRLSRILRIYELHVRCSWVFAFFRDNIGSLAQLLTLASHVAYNLLQRRSCKVWRMAFEVDNEGMLFKAPVLQHWQKSARSGTLSRRSKGQIPFGRVCSRKGQIIWTEIQRRQEEIRIKDNAIKPHPAVPIQEAQ